MAKSLDIIELIIQPPFIYFIIIGIVAYIIYYVYTHKEEEPEFQIEDFRDTVYFQHKKILNLFGVHTDSRLVKGLEPIGNIKKWYRYKGTVEKTEYDKDGKLKPVKDSQKQADLMIFQIGGGGLLSFIFGDNPDYVVIDVTADKDILTYNSENRTWNLKETVNLVPYAGVFISSKDAESYCNNISFARSLEENMTYQQNYAKKITYMEFHQASMIERLGMKEQLKKSGWDSYKKKVLASNKDIEDDVDDED